MNKLPRVTVLMPVYNGENYLRQSIESILQQTYGDFEFLIINDGSTDGSEEIIRSYNDPRIRLINNEANCKLVATLNRGLTLARGYYLARMDCDDISLPTRLEKQVNFMDRCQDIGVCGTWLKLFGRAGSDDVWKVPKDSETIRSFMLFYSVIYHPTVIIRKEILKKHDLNYDTGYFAAEDYALWIRLMEHSKASNLQEVLLLRRIHSNSVGVTQRPEQVESANKIRMDQIQKLGIIPALDDFKIHQAISYLNFQNSKLFIAQVETWLMKLKEANEKKAVYSESAFANVLAQQWFAVCSAASGMGLWAYRKYHQSHLSKGAVLHWKQKLMFSARCGLKG
jgi:glycosyltransferase involved in cell wall biosynthesis